MAIRRHRCDELSRQRHLPQASQPRFARGSNADGERNETLGHSLGRDIRSDVDFDLYRRRARRCQIRVDDNVSAILVDRTDSIPAGYSAFLVVNGRQSLFREDCTDPIGTWSPGDRHRTVCICSSPGLPGIFRVVPVCPAPARFLVGFCAGNSVGRWPRCSNCTGRSNPAPRAWGI